MARHLYQVELLIIDDLVSEFVTAYSSSVLFDLINTRLLVNTSNGYTFYVSPYTGKILGYIENGDGSSLPPVAAGSQVIITTVDADIIAYQ